MVPVDYYYHTDDLYSVMAVTDASGNVVERYEFSRVRCADHSGLNMQTVMRMAGHSRIETTMRYYAATTADQLELVRRASAAALAQSDPKVTQYASVSGTCV